MGIPIRKIKVVLRICKSKRAKIIEHTKFILIKNLRRYGIFPLSSYLKNTLTEIKIIV